MSNEFSLEYRFAVKSPKDAHHVQVVSDLMLSAPNPVNFECTQDGSPYAGQFHVRASGNIGITDCQMAAPGNSKTLFVSERVRKHIARNLSFEFNIPIWLGGECRLTTAGRTHIGNVGDFVVTNNDAPYRVQVLNRGHACTLSLPASWDRIGDVRLENSFGTLFSGSDRRHNGLADYARHLLSHPNALALPGAAEKLYDVIALALNPRAKSEHQSGLMALIRNYIDVHSSNPDLSPAELAAKFDISVRYLHRLFAATEVSFTEYLIEQRLIQARHMLADAHNHQKKILSVAYDCGFRNLNHFGRRFRMRFGVTPGEFRQMASMQG